MRKGKARRKLGPQCRTKYVNGEQWRRKVILIGQARQR